MATEERSFSWTRSDSARRVAAEEADARERIAGRRTVALAAVLLVASSWAGWPYLDHDLGPWLDTLTAAQRAGAGLLVGLAVAAPQLIGVLPRLRPWAWRLLAGWHLVVLGVLVLAWLPPRHADGYAEALYRREAGWFIPVSVAVWLVTAAGLCWLGLRRGSRRPATVRRRRHQGEFLGGRTD